MPASEAFSPAIFGRHDALNTGEVNGRAVSLPGAAKAVIIAERSIGAVIRIATDCFPLPRTGLQVTHMRARYSENVLVPLSDRVVELPRFP
jgi:hypothetical protein